MPQQVLNSIENNFTKGLITEFTGLNFPENAATDSDNTEYTLIGDVLRREGIDVETNGIFRNALRINSAVSTYKWNNVGGDGATQLVVEQIGGTISFYKSSVATTAFPLSTQLLVSTINLGVFQVPGGTFDPALECQYADGNGYLFIFQPSIDPIYCSYNNGVITANVITVQIRDFVGDIDGFAVTTRPTTNTNPHLYNLTNQGWTSGSAWNASSNTVYTGAQISGILGSFVFTVAAGLSITPGDLCSGFSTMNETIVPPAGVDYNQGFQGNVTAYSGTTLTINITYSNAFPGNFYNIPASQFNSTGWAIIQLNSSLISTWTTQVGGIPSNADVWWYFKNSSGIFAPSTTLANVTLGSGGAPRGHFILQAFKQLRSFVSSISGITDITTTVRPRTGCWFQGRVWYTGVDASQPATGTANSYSWTEQLYFSQIITDPSQFGNCYQTNDPTSQTLFNLLPTDGGIIQIQGCGSIYKLFPLQNALLVFAANGVWYITGSTGIGFAANDYTIIKLSSVRSISSFSFVDVLGLPMFWNQEGIYQVEFAKQGTHLLAQPLHVNPLEVNPITLGTILSFYNSIPQSSKQYARGAYDPIEYVVQWVYRDTEASNVADRYTFNKILNYNTANKAFFPYTVDNSNTSINGIIYVVGPGGTGAPPAQIKYVASRNNGNIYWADEHDSTLVDWLNGNGSGGVNYVSTFTTGYKLHGQGERRFQIPYIYVYSRLGQPVSYYIQSLWDYPLNVDSGRWGVNQLVNINSPNFGMAFRRHRLRGWGLVLQIRITSVDGQPFDIMGWSLYETANQGV